MFALCNPNMTGLLQGKHPLNLGPKWPTPCWFEHRRHSIANCGRKGTDSATVTMEGRAYRKLPSLFLMVLSLTPCDFPFPQMGVPYAPNIRKWSYLCNGWSDPLHVWFKGGVFGDGGSNGAIFDSNKSRWRPPPSWIISNGHISATAHDLLI